MKTILVAVFCLFAITAHAQGRLTVSDCEVATDQIGKTQLFYKPCGSSTIKIYDGSSMQSISFVSGPMDTTGLTLTLGSVHTANSSFDVFVGINGAVTECTGPAWPASDLASRGLTTVYGMLVNAAAMTCWAGTNTFSCPQYQCTYLGSINIGSIAGQLNMHRSYGQNRRNDVWNAYNQKPVYLKSGDTTFVWAPAYQPSWGPYLGNSGNNITVFTGLPQPVKLQLITGAWLQAFAGYTAQFFTGIGWDSTNTPTGSMPTWDLEGESYRQEGGPGQGKVASLIQPSSLGVHVATSLMKTQSVDGSLVNSGKSCVYVAAQEANFILTAEYQQ